MRILTMVALVVVMLATQSGCRGWSRFGCRGDDCWEGGEGCADGMVSGSTLLPPNYGPSTTILPGPVTTTTAP